MSSGLALFALLFLIIAVYLVWSWRQGLRQGELDAWYDAGREAGYQAAVSDVLRMAQESDRVEVNWE